MISAAAAAPVFGLRRVYHRWLAQHRPIPDALWQQAVRHAPYACALRPNDRRRLRELATVFMHIKALAPAAALTVTDAMRTRIALKACIPILNLGLDFYADWSSMVLYPGDFRARHEYVDEDGVEHHETMDLCGESLSQGPIVLSWDAITAEHPNGDQDLVIHECAHKLDILNGVADGYPPLHRHMSTKTWANDFQRAFDRFCRDVDRGHDTRLDPYAATDPAEFFAVISETFFAAPEIVYEDFPDVYRQLAAFYRQDPYRLLTRTDAP